MNGGIETRGATEGGSDLGCWDFLILDFRKIETFRKGPKWAEVRDSWHFIRYLRLFQLYIDDFHHFSQKIRNFFEKCTNFQKSLAPAAPRFWDFSQFFAQKLGFFSKSHSPPRPVTPPVAPLIGTTVRSSESNTINYKDTNISLLPC